MSARPCSGPSRIAIAAARFSSMTDDGSARTRTSYSPTICAQSVGADRLGREVGASEVALIEDEIDDVQHARETIREVRTLGDVVGDPGVADLGLGANDALGQRRRGDEKGRRDLLGRESANLAQRHGDLCIGIQCRVTAGENEAKAVIYHVVVLDLGSLLRYIEFTGDFAPALAQPVDRTEASRRNQPGPRAGRYAFYRPALDRRRER